MFQISAKDSGDAGLNGINLSTEGACFGRDITTVINDISIVT